MAEYFISTTSGNNANNGLTTATAFQTLDYTIPYLNGLGSTSGHILNISNLGDHLPTAPYPAFNDWAQTLRVWEETPGLGNYEQTPQMLANGVSPIPVAVIDSVSSSSPVISFSGPWWYEGIKFVTAITGGTATVFGFDPAHPALANNPQFGVPLFDGCFWDVTAVSGSPNTTIVTCPNRPAGLFGCGFTASGTFSGLQAVGSYDTGYDFVGCECYINANVTGTSIFLDSTSRSISSNLIVLGEEMLSGRSGDFTVIQTSSVASGFLPSSVRNNTIVSLNAVANRIIGIRANGSIAGSYSLIDNIICGLQGTSSVPILTTGASYPFIDGVRRHNSLYQSNAANVTGTFFKEYTSVAFPFESTTDFRLLAAEVVNNKSSFLATQSVRGAVQYSASGGGGGGNNIFILND